MPGAQTKKIGGFLGLELPLARPAGQSAWQLMTRRAHQLCARRTVRAVLAEMLSTLSSDRVWYPAYFCPEAVLEVPGVTNRFFPLTPKLQPDATWLGQHIGAEDVVLAANPFGQPISDAFRALVDEHRDVFWIEDCAQGLEPGPAWGDWRLFSPRKIFGVPDGGIGSCLNPDKTLTLPDATDPAASFSDLDALAPYLWRFEDALETRNDIWFPAFQEAERQSFGNDAGLDRAGISALSQQLLDAIDADLVLARRKANAERLFDQLPSGLTLWDTLPKAAPLGVPILVQDRDALASALAAKGLFCASHWRQLPSNPAEFPHEHELAAAMLTLPCDQRYGAQDMDTLAAAVLATATPL